MTRKLLAWAMLFAGLFSALPWEGFVRNASGKQWGSFAVAPTNPNAGQQSVPRNDTGPKPDECKCLCCPGIGTILPTVTSHVVAAPPVVAAVFPSVRGFRPRATFQQIFHPPRDSWTSRAIPVRAGPEGLTMSISDRSRYWSVPLNSAARVSTPA